ncbi:hypothetical protein GCM10010191_06390 [Actinomadura vinacea]|uniref:Uncharacterized protein n=2 Tax=Actinomadura vinacea TaxID=115336 RepID=A0ABN3IDK2_9ACTN
MVDAVRFAGGWLFDHVMAGGEVLVLTADHGDPRPLRILGARAVDLECALSSPVQGPWPPRAIAAGADSCGSDARVRRIVLKAIDDGLADVRLWGDQDTADLGGGVGSVRHRLSVAARAFKAHALAAAAASSCDGGTATETFRSGESLRASGGS